MARPIAVRGQRGATTSEYLLLVFIGACVLVFILMTLSDAFAALILNLWDTIVNTITGS